MNLSTFFMENPRAAIAFSGGVDSAYLLYAALKEGADVTAYYVKSAFQPEFEYQDALRLAEELSAKMKVIPIDVLSDETVRKNPADRCYYCKRQIFSRILDAAAADGYTLILDGTNASDDLADRPGVKALRELQVRSPLLECGLTKPEIRRLSKEAGLFTWDKPAYACLATRIPTSEEITPEKLENTEKAEAFLSSLGFSDFRVRLFNGCARLQVKDTQTGLVLEKKEAILNALKPLYKAVFLDLETRP